MRVLVCPQGGSQYERLGVWYGFHAACQRLTELVRDFPQQCLPGGVVRGMDADRHSAGGFIAAAQVQVVPPVVQQLALKTYPI